MIPNYPQIFNICFASSGAASMTSGAISAAFSALADEIHTLVYLLDIVRAASRTFDQAVFLGLDAYQFGKTVSA